MSVVVRLVALTEGSFFSRRAQFTKQAHQVGQLIIRVQPARIWQHPDASVGETFVLFANHRFRSREGLPIRADTKYRDDSRTMSARLGFQSTSAPDEIFAGQFGRCRRGVRDDVGNSEAEP